MPNVGIGTTVPNYSLDVAGTANFTGLLSVNAGMTENAPAFANSTAAYTIPNGANIARVTLTANTTITLPATTSTGATSFTMTVKVKQDATGGRTLAWSGGANSIKWDINTVPNIATAATQETIFQFIKFGDETIWYGMQVWQEQ